MNGDEQERLARERPRESAALALGLWVAFHAILLVGVAADYRISANFTAREVALPLILSGGVLVSGLLFGGLVASTGGTLIAGAVAFVTIQFAGYMTPSGGAARTLVCTVQIWGWLASLRLLRLFGSRQIVSTSAALALYVTGSVLLWYCFREFGAQPLATDVVRYAAPLLNIGTWVYWVHVGAIALAALLIWSISRQGRRDQNCSAPQMPM